MPRRVRDVSQSLTWLSKKAGTLAIAGALVFAVALQAAQSDALVADAARTGNHAVVRKLLQDGADVNAAQGDG